MSDPVDIRCPKCDRWLAEVNGYGRAVCARCGYEVTVRDKEARLTSRKATPTIRA